MIRLTKETLNAQTLGEVLFCSMDQMKKDGKKI